MTRASIRRAAVVLSSIMCLVPRLAAGQSRPSHRLSERVDEATRRELLAARDAIWHAWFANDTAQLQRLLPRATTAVEPGGSWQNRQEILDGAREFAEGRGKLTRLEFSDTQILLDGDIAVVHSTYRLETVTSGKTAPSRGRATEVFVREGGRWVNPFWHLQPLR